MHTVVHIVGAFPNQTDGLPGRHLLGPEVRPPQQERSDDLPPGRIEVEAGLTLDLILNEPTYRKGAFVCERFGIDQPQVLLDRYTIFTLGYLALSVRTIDASHAFRFLAYSRVVSSGDGMGSACLIHTIWI